MIDEYVINTRNWVTALLAVISFALFFTAGAIIFFKKRKAAKFSKTKGKVVDFSQRISSKGGFMFAPIVEIVVKGKTYRATSRVATSWTSYVKGDTLDVKYDPSNPNRMVFGSAFSQYLVAFIFGIQGAVMALVTVLVFLMLSRFANPQGFTFNILVAFFGFVAFLLWSTCVGWAYLNYRKTAHYKTAEGTVVEFSNRPGNTGDFLYAPIVEITVKGKTYRKVSQVATSWASHVQGDKVSVRYDPANPGKMEFGGFFQKNIGPSVIAIIAMVFTLITALVYFITN